MSNIYPLVNKKIKLVNMMSKTTEVLKTDQIRKAISTIDRKIIEIRKSRHLSTSIEAIYFPYSRLLDATSLKRSILIFDKIWFLDSIDKISRKVTLTYSNYLPVKELKDNWENIKNDYDFLESKSIISYYDTSLINQDFKNQIAENIILDSKDKKLSNIIQPNINIWSADSK